VRSFFHGGVFGFYFAWIFEVHKVEGRVTAVAVLVEDEVRVEIVLFGLWVDACQVRLFHWLMKCLSL